LTVSLSATVKVVVVSLDRVQCSGAERSGVERSGVEKIVGFCLARQSGAQQKVGCNIVMPDREECRREAAGVSPDRVGCNG
jgi:hypothetical protein